MVPNACTGRQLVGSSFFFFCQCYSHHLVCANQQLRTGSFLDAASQCVWAEASMYSPILFSIWHVFIISSLSLVFCQCYSATIWCVRIDSVRTERFGDADSWLWPPSRARASGCCAITASVSRKHIVSLGGVSRGSAMGAPLASSRPGSELKIIRPLTVNPGQSPLLPIVQPIFREQKCPH